MERINILAVLVAVIASGALGALWYSPVLFLPAWSRAAGRQPNQSPVVYIVTLLAALGAALAFAFWLGPNPPLTVALHHGMLAGVCFAAGSLALNYSFAARGLTLWLIDGGFHIARFIVFALILGLWH